MRSGRISCILEARMTAAAAARLMIDLSAGRNGRPSGGKSVWGRGVVWRKGKVRVERGSEEDMSSDV